MIGGNPMKHFYPCILLTNVGESSIFMPKLMLTKVSAIETSELITAEEIERLERLEFSRIETDEDYRKLGETFAEDE